ncbi:hypothetical protein [uncultured Hyphomicrobium sp.]|uniref:hypothetical protein n=1 Tax=uncultured Hyphomicrobium sp. TaxID=194373 RepID=UPI0025E38113|nr:hypothetical protein [uncultured Hyphomicrobium sp.]
MSWNDDLASLSEALDETFGTQAVMHPMLARPNSRAAPDPKRPSFSIVGIFHENHRYAGDSARNSDGLKETKIASTECSFEAERGCFVSKPTQGDIIELVELGRRFRVMDITYGMPGRTKLILESLERLEMA